MRILAIETEKPGFDSNDFKPYLRDEAKKVWDFYQEDFIRELYFHSDQSTAVLMLESRDLKEASEKLSQLPLVSKGLIQFELIPLGPYPGFKRLFDEL